MKAGRSRPVPSPRAARAGAGPAKAARGEAGRWVVAFVVRLLAGWALAIGILALAPGIERWAVAATVTSVEAALRLLALEPAVSGATLQLGSSALRIIPECTPVMPVVLLATAMVAYPAPWRWKLMGVAVGIPLLWLYNVGRMLALVATLVWWPASFTFMHVYLWQSITLLVVSAMFLAWLRLEPAGRARA